MRGTTAGILAAVVAAALPARHTADVQDFGRRLDGDDVCLHVTMADTYDDGWDNAQLTLSVDGSLVWAGTIDYGYSPTYVYVCAFNSNTCVSIEVVRDPDEWWFPHEIHWEVEADETVGGLLVTGDGDSYDQLCLRATPTATPTTPSPTATFSPTTVCHPYETCATAASPGELDAVLAAASQAGSRASVAIDVTASIAVTGQISISNGAAVAFTSLNGEGELVGRTSRRVLKVTGEATHVRLEGIRVRAGRADGQNGGSGGCILVEGGATVEIDDTEIYDCKAETNVENEGVRRCGRGRNCEYFNADPLTSSMAAP